MDNASYDLAGHRAAAQPGPAPAGDSAVHAAYMAIDKESNGMPEVNVHRSTTKVNLGVIVGIVLFFLIGAAAVFWLSQRN